MVLAERGKSRRGRGCWREEGKGSEGVGGGGFVPEGVEEDGGTVGEGYTGGRDGGWRGRGAGDGGFAVDSAGGWGRWERWAGCRGRPLLVALGWRVG